VRGAYRRADTSNPMLLAKSCHDLDLLHWILDDPVQRVSSVGSLLHFRPESVGPEIPDRCTDGCPVEDTCTYSALRLYAPDERVEGDDIRSLLRWFPLSDPPTYDRASRRIALQTSPFGRCVYRCDNDVVDHQLVTMELASGTSVAFAMHGHSADETRTMRYDGTLATLRATFSEQPEITVQVHGRDEVEQIDLSGGAGSSLDHGGGDLGVLRAFAASLAGGGDGLSSDARTSLESHLVGWAAEEARTTRTVVDVAAFRSRWLAG
jgi:predicted dehydrogenase